MTSPMMCNPASHLLASLALVLGIAGISPRAEAQEPRAIEPRRDEARTSASYDEAERRLSVEAAQIKNPSERALAFARVAQTLITSDRLLRAPGADPEETAIIDRFSGLPSDLGQMALQEQRMLSELDVLRLKRFEQSLPRYRQAYEALAQLNQAALEMSERVMKDARLLAGVRITNSMVTQMMRDVAPDSSYSSRDAVQQLPLPISARVEHLALARRAVALAGEMAAAISESNFTSMALAEVADTESSASNQVARFLTRAERARGNRLADASSTRQFLMDDPTATPEQKDAAEKSYQQTLENVRNSFDEQMSKLGPYPDIMLAEATRIAGAIPIGIWRYRALVDVAIDAADSDQFVRAKEIAQSIPQSQARADALIRTAEAQALDGRSADASETYQEAVVAIASIAQVAPRRELALVLLESLVAVNRFEDARAAVTLVRDPAFRVVALSVVARAMGEDGLDQSAYDWIEREVPPAERDQLRRNVIEGMKKFVYEIRKPKTGTGLLTPSELERYRNP